jgi:hypothetical protein
VAQQYVNEGTAAHLRVAQADEEDNELGELRAVRM